MPFALSTNWEERADACIERWGLTEVDWTSHVSTARVAFCVSSFGPTVLKVNLEPDVVANEARMLAYLGSDMCPRMFAVAQDLDAMILERLDVVEDLSALYPDAGREIAAWLPLYQAVAAGKSSLEGFRTLANFAEIFERLLERSLRPDVARIIREARDRQGILMGSAGENRLLHGDMHHFNILRERTGQWRLIDPHGVVGHPHYELGAFLRNPWGPCYREPGVKERLAERIEILSERLTLPKTRVAEFGFYGAAFPVAWSIEEDGDDFEGMIVMSEACLSLIDSFGSNL